MNNSIDQTKDTFVEPICDANLHNEMIFVSKDPALVKLYDDAEGSFWPRSDIHASEDIPEFQQLTPDEKVLVTNVVAFFASADQLVQMNLAQQFMNDIKHPDSLNFMAYQMYNESVHANVYSNFLYAFIPSQDIPKYLTGLGMLPSVIAKRDFVLKYTNRDTSNFTKRLLAFAMIEHIFFSSSFATIFWLKSRRKLPQLCLSNSLISKDEALHVEHAICLYNNHIVKKLSTEEFYSLLNEAMTIEKNFANEAICAGKFVGIDGSMMSQYIEYISNWLCVRLGYPRISSVKNPFEFMNSLHLEIKSNFFEGEGSSYSATSGSNTTFKPVEIRKRKLISIE
jgi:ribonucleotide reductase beta subunit family protein with ferritin-like domain